MLGHSPPIARPAETGSWAAPDRMKTLAAERCRTEIAHRLATVHAGSAARWGRMSAHQMICHLCDSCRVALGERSVSPATGLLQRTLVKWIALYAAVAVAGRDRDASGGRSGARWDEAGRIRCGRLRARGAARAGRRANGGGRHGGASDFREDVARRLAPVGVPPRRPSPPTVRRLTDVVSPSWPARTYLTVT